MHGRGPLRAVALVWALVWLMPVASGREPDFDPWTGGPDRFHRFRPDWGEEEDDEDEEMRRHRATHLRRCRMNGLESAQYSVAELLLQRGDTKGAVATLRKLAASTRNASLRDMTHYNLGEIFRRRLRDADNAGKHYRQVMGLLRHRAHKRMVSMLVQMGEVAEAAKVTEGLIAKTKEKGAKLALLHRLARVYKRHGMADEALAIYRRVTKEFTPDDMKQIIAAIERQAAADARKLHNLMRGGGDAWREREELKHKRIQELRAAGRWDELRAYQKTLEKALRKLQRRGDAPPVEDIPIEQPGVQEF